MTEGFTIARTLEDAISREARFATARIVAAYVAHHPVDHARVPELIGAVHGALASAQPGEANSADRKLPAVPIARAVTPDHVVCLECGQRFKMIKRHLRIDHGLRPDEYRQRWRLAHDHPMVAPNYAKRRSDLAREIGLGRTAS